MKVSVFAQTQERLKKSVSDGPSSNELLDQLSINESVEIVLFEEQNHKCLKDYF